MISSFQGKMSHIIIIIIIIVDIHTYIHAYIQGLAVKFPGDFETRNVTSRVLCPV